MSKLSKFLLSAAAVATVASGLSAVTPAPEASAAETAVRVSTVNTAVKDSKGRTWAKDSGFVGGTSVPRSSWADIKGTVDDRLYQSERHGVKSWSAPVANGTYQVTVKLAETWYSTKGARIFSITAEGQPVVTDLDLVAAAGKNVAYDKTVTVKVTDGRVNLAFSAKKDSAKIDAIQVLKVADAPAATPTPTQTATPVVTPSPRPTNPQPTLPTATTPPATTPAPAAGQPATSGPWKSGASGTGATNGAFAKWRGTDMGISGTWSDNNLNAANFWQLDPKGSYGSWQKDLDIAVGALDRGESWSAGARGSYDARWRHSLTTLKKKWGDRPGTLYIRFAHEMNGNWYPWSVNSANHKDFVASWKRYRAIQKDVFPAAKLVFNVNRESVNTGIDWRKMVPGYAEGNVKAYVDVMGVDYYNQYPYVGDWNTWNSSLQQVDKWGAPKGLAKHLEFAKSVGLPLGVGEWSGNADKGDSPVFMEGMFNFFKANGGTGAGKLLYEVQFNVDKDGRRWLLTEGTRQPKAAAKYRELF
ncbi:malectin domain-containing carbohydrate-binding protein [Paenibacillus sp. TRM 82003]|uniref:malectin n=1 Tax=Kineococcus sp. TRM81007 TaxID=2925831 RepID=UPI001F572EC5|nr:malectin [Kineococcus sp. TRM81007]MCI2238918.1 malectin domain-containing carbohydrate-binding protein [Kineococcus sp. TRM81007]MCI3924325.1 malectin domain-containing carbohydrate-binding protein [Paenibacillus sp. TRM 82003]